MLTQLARNENENMLEIGNGGGDLDGDNEDCPFLIQGAIEHNTAQSLQKDDHVMPSDDENQSS
eukprot:6951348-Ditylum_brightwellii.AAC.1